VIQARSSGDPLFASTRVVVTSHGTDELHRLLNGASLEQNEAASTAALERIGRNGAPSRKRASAACAFTKPS
jgi:hypothetical protein